MVMAPPAPGERPRETCHVMFEIRAMKDGQASSLAGHVIYKDVEYAVLTPPGGQLVVNKEVTPELIDRFRPQYEAWKRNEESPENGTSVRMWPVLTPSEVKRCLDAGVRTIEAVSEMNEQCITKVGMGSRALKDKAIAWLQSSSLSGITTERLQELKIENTDLIAQNSQLMARNEELKIKLQEERRENKTVDIGELQDIVTDLKLENAELHGKLKSAPKPKRKVVKRKAVKKGAK